MELAFPELRGGPSQGLNDAGVENFQGAIDTYLSRECGQNTGDAAAQPGVITARLEFQRLSVAARDVPGIAQLRATLAACLEKWGNDPKAREFFERAVELSRQDEIPVLRISDYGTTGLTGGDTDEAGRWFALVKSQGVSNKGDTAGGSFGIGKSSPFAASRFRTVFYGTRTGSGSVALQGVSRLVTHRNSQGRLTQGVGFVGDYDDGQGRHDPVFRAIRDPERIPHLFRRTEPGTDIWVIGYRSGEEWARNLVRSILANFWPAIHRELIEFRVGDQLISKATLPGLIQAHIGQEEFEAHHYYQAVHNQPIRRRLTRVGDCELYLSSAGVDLPRRVCMVRGTGMRIFDYLPRACRVPFSGLFICTDREGNKLLRQLEPPKHDTWDPKRTEDDSGRRALDEIKAWIREEVKKLNPHFSGKAFNEDELAKYIPDTDQDELPSDSTGDSQEESLEPKPRVPEVPPKPVYAKPLVTVPATEGDSAEDFGDDDGTRPGSGGNGGGGGSGTHGGSSPRRPIRLVVRSFSSGADCYDFVIRSAEDFEGSLRVSAVGEDGADAPVSLRTAALGDGSETAFAADGDTIKDVRIRANHPLRLRVKIDAVERRALRVVPRS